MSTPRIFNVISLNPVFLWNHFIKWYFYFLLGTLETWEYFIQFFYMKKYFNVLPKSYSNLILFLHKTYKRWYTDMHISAMTVGLFYIMYYVFYFLSCILEISKITNIYIYILGRSFIDFIYMVTFCFCFLIQWKYKN